MNATKNGLQQVRRTGKDPQAESSQSIELTKVELMKGNVVQCLPLWEDSQRNTLIYRGLQDPVNQPYSNQLKRAIAKRGRRKESCTELRNAIFDE